MALQPAASDGDDRAGSEMSLHHSISSRDSQPPSKAREMVEVLASARGNSTASDPFLRHEGESPSPEDVSKISQWLVKARFSKLCAMHAALPE